MTASKNERQRTGLPQAGKFISRLFFFSFLITRLSFAQDSISIIYCKRIKAEEFKENLGVLASDLLEGRETGKPGQKKAAAYISQYFSSLGLKPISHGTFLQDFPINLRSNQGMNLEINQKFFLFMRDYYYADEYADTTLVLSNIIFAGYGIADKNYNDYDDLNVEGKPVLIFDGEPEKKKFLTGGSDLPTSWSTDPEKKLAVIRDKKPSVAFIITDSMDQVIERQNYIKRPAESGRPKITPSAIPVIYITREMARNFFPELTEEVLDKTKSKIDRKGKPRSFGSATSAFIRMVGNTDAMKGQNVVGFLEGTDKKSEVLVVTAHYDHLGIRDTLIYHGADDDGSGTSAIMTLAKIFSQAKKEGHAPRRSILFMAVSGEEKGLLGSTYYVNHPLISLNKTVADLNIDMIGRTDEKHDSLGITDYLYLIGSDKLSTDLHRINEKANATFTKLELDYTFNRPGDPNRFYFRSDHYNFAKNKIPIIFYFNGTHRDYHKPTDTVDKINFDLLAKRTQLVFLTAWQLANMEQKIQVDVKNDMEGDSK